MKKVLLVVAAIMGVIALAPAAQARTHVGIYANFGCCGYGYGPYAAYPGYYSPYYYPYYVAPPPVVYAVPPPSPIVYAAPQAPVYAEPPAPVAEAPVAANQTSPTYIDAAGRTCRQFQSTSGGQAYGTACLQPDGSWRAVQ